MSRTAIGHHDMRGVNEASSERDYAMHRTHVHGCTVLYTVLVTRWEQNIRRDHVPLPPPHESRQKYNLGHHNPQQGGKRRPLDRILLSSQKRGALPLFAISSRDRHVGSWPEKITSQSRPSSLNRRSCVVRRCCRPHAAHQEPHNSAK